MYIHIYLYVLWVDSKVSQPKQNVHLIFTFLVTSKYTKQFTKTGMKIEISLDHPNIKLFLQNTGDKTAGIILIVQIWCPCACPTAAPGAQFSLAMFNKKGAADAAGAHSTAFWGDAAPLTPKPLPHL